MISSLEKAFSFLYFRVSYDVNRPRPLSNGDVIVWLIVFFIIIKFSLPTPLPPTLLPRPLPPSFFIIIFLNTLIFTIFFLSPFYFVSTSFSYILFSFFFNVNEWLGINNYVITPIQKSKKSKQNNKMKQKKNTWEIVCFCYFILITLSFMWRRTSLTTLFFTIICSSVNFRMNG